MGRCAAWAVFGILLVLALVWTWPLAGDLGGSIPYTHQPREGLEDLPLFSGDHLQFYYRLWLFVDSLAKGRPFTPHLHEFNRRMGEPVINAQFFPLSFLYFLFTPLGNTAAYNIVLILTFPLAGVAVFLLLRIYGAGFWGGLTGGAVAAFIPYRVAQLATGHPNAFLYLGLPLLLLLLELYLRRGQARWAWLAGVTFFFQVFMELHVAYYTGLAMVLYLPFRWLIPVSRWAEVAQPRDPSPPPSRLFLLVPPLAVFIFRLAHAHLTGDPPLGWGTASLSALLWGAAALFLIHLAAAALAALLRCDTGGMAARLARALAPTALLALYLLRILWPIPYLGKVIMAAILLLSAANLLRLFRQLRGERPLELRPWGIFRGRLTGVAALGAGAVAAFLWVFYVKGKIFLGTAIEKGRSAGEAILYTPRLEDVVRRVNERNEFYVYPGVVALLLILLVFLLPRLRRRSAAEGWVPLFYSGAALFAYLLCLGPRGEVIAPLYGTLRELAPFLAYGRVSSRAMILFVPLFAVLAGLAADALLAAVAGRGRALRHLGGAILVAGILADYAPGSSIGLTRTPESSLAYESAVRGLGEGGQLLELPLWPGDSAWSSVYQYWVTRYGHDMVNGYNPVVPAGYHQKVFQPLAGVNLGHLGKEEVAILRQLGVRRIMLHEDVFPSQVSPFPFRLTLENLSRSPYLRLVMHEEWLWLFEVRDDAEAGGEDFRPASSPWGVVFDGVSPRMNPAGRETREGLEVAVGTRPDLPVIRGPDRLFPPGEFRLSLRMALSGDPRERRTALLRMRTREGTVLGEVLLQAPAGAQGVFHDYVYDFALARPERISVEVYPVAETRVAVRHLSLTYADQPEPVGRIQWEDLPHSGRIFQDERAAGGMGVLLERGVDPVMGFDFGPQRLLPAGEWRLRVAYALGAGSGAGGRLQVGTLSGQSLATLDLDRPGDAPDGRSVDFSLPADGFLNLHLEYAGTRDLLLDYLEVSRR
jgi:hypothetical protein